MITNATKEQWQQIDALRPEIMSMVTQQASDEEIRKAVRTTWRRMGYEPIAVLIADCPVTAAMWLQKLMLMCQEAQHDTSRELGPIIDVIGQNLGMSVSSQLGGYTRVYRQLISHILLMRNQLVDIRRACTQQSASNLAWYSAQHYQRMVAADYDGGQLLAFWRGLESTLNSQVGNLCHDVLKNKLYSCLLDIDRPLSTTLHNKLAVSFDDLRLYHQPATDTLLRLSAMLEQSIKMSITHQLEHYEGYDLMQQHLRIEMRAMLTERLFALLARDLYAGLENEMAGQLSQHMYKSFMNPYASDMLAGLSGAAYQRNQATAQLNRNLLLQISSAVITDLKRVSYDINENLKEAQHTHIAHEIKNKLWSTVCAAMWEMFETRMSALLYSQLKAGVKTAIGQDVHKILCDLTPSALLPGVPIHVLELMNERVFTNELTQLVATSDNQIVTTIRDKTRNRLLDSTLSFNLSMARSNVTIPRLLNTHLWNPLWSSLENELQHSLESAVRVYASEQFEQLGRNMPSPFHVFEEDNPLNFHDLVRDLAAQTFLNVNQTYEEVHREYEEVHQTYEEVHREYEEVHQKSAETYKQIAAQVSAQMYVSIGWLAWYGWYRGGKILGVQFDDALFKEFEQWVRCVPVIYANPVIPIVSRMPVKVNWNDTLLHNDSGHSVEFRSGWGLWSINGVSVDEQIVMHPETQTIKQIEEEKNQDVKAIRIARFGWVRYLKESKAVCLDYRQNDIEGTQEALYTCDDATRRLVVTCPTKRMFALGVPSEVATCEQAQRWLAGGRNFNVIART